MRQDPVRASLGGGRPFGHKPLPPRPVNDAVRRKPRSSEVLVGGCLALGLFAAGSVALAISFGLSPFHAVAPTESTDYTAAVQAMPVAKIARVDAPAKDMPDFSIVDRMTSGDRLRGSSSSSGTAEPLPAAASLVPESKSETTSAVTKAHASETTSVERRASSETTTLTVASLAPAASTAVSVDASTATETAPLEREAITSAPALSPKTLIEPAPAPSVAALPTPSPAPTEPLRKAEPRPSVSPDELAHLRTRAEKAIEQGDIGSARLFLERGMRAEDVVATLLLAQTYDPTMLQRWRIRGLRPDSVRAQALYERARELGSRDAEAFLVGLKRATGG